MGMTFRQTANYRPDIDGLRGIAVIAAVIFHAFPKVLPNGFVGADVFFVISGYLISGIIFSALNEQTFSFSGFYIRRIKRIFPALIALLAGCLAIGWFVMPPEAYKLLGIHIAASTLFVENINLWHEVGYFDIEAELKPLLHLWSLSVEEQFYLFYPLLVWVAWKARFNLLILLLLLGAVSLSTNIGRLAEHPHEVFFSLHTRFWELLTGGALAYMTLYKRNFFLTFINNVKNKNIFLDVLSAAGLILILGTMVSASHAEANTLLVGWLAAVVGTCFLISAGTDTRINKHILANRFIVYMGLISYPLYLWHWSLLSFLRLTQYDHHPSSMQKLIAIAISFVLAWITYEWIEKPVRYKNNSKIKIIILVLLLILTGLAGVYVAINNGLSSRYPKPVRAIAYYNYDYKRYTKYGECWVDRDPPLTQFSPRCIGALASPASKHTLLVWGDSHAAHIYPAIDELFGNKGDVAEFTRSTCPPILGLGMQFSTNHNTHECIAGNDEVFALIKKYRPESVVLYALWGGFSERWTAESPIANQLLDTLHKIHSAGVQNIILMGPAPQWTADLPYLVLEAMLDDVPQYRIPQRMNHSLKPRSAIIDVDLGTLVAQEKGVQYFSTMNALCNTDGCLVRTTADADSLTAYDYGHFTHDGALYIAKQLPIVASP